jgi:protein-tyrosine phosphatase
MSSSPSTPPVHLWAPATRANALRAAQLLQDGSLVVLPTETVYGIAVNLLSPDSRQAVRLLKAHASATDAPAEPPPVQWVIHVAQPDDLLSWVPHVSALGRRLITKALPGPIAFQIKLTPEDEAAARHRLGPAADEAIVEGYLTFRCPDLPQTQDVLAAAGVPVAIVGAGTGAQPGVFEPQDLPAALLGDAHAPKLALDAGPTRYRRSSTVVKITGDAYAVTRPGVIDERIIHKFADFTILFLCSGNTCRSPMASAIATKVMADRLGIAPSELPLRHILVQSAGLHASRGMRAALEALDTVKEYGVDLSTHFSQPATADLLRRADVIYTMTNAHREEVLDLLPGAERKTFTVDPEGDVADPIGSGLSVYQQVASRLHSVLKNRLGELSV